MPAPAQPQDTGGKKVTPNLVTDPEATRALSLAVLQRLDPAVEDVLIAAAHVALYDFDIGNNQWSRKDVEGSLFVVKRNTQPRFQLIVMNRRSTDNLVEDLLSDFEYELQPPYLLYRNAAQEVNGIWFYNQHDCEAVTSLFGRILNAYAKVPPKPKIPSTKSEFEELEAVPASTATDGPLEHPPSTTAVVAGAPNESLANHFNGAVTTGNVSSAGRAHTSTESTTSSQVQLVIPTATPAHQITHPQGVSLAPPPPLHESNSHASHLADLLTPAFFASPSPSSTSVAPPDSSMTPTAPPPHTSKESAQGPSYGAPLEQPFPPPATPPPSLTPTNNEEPVISRDRVKDALQRLVQSDKFIDLICRELQNAQV